MRINFLTQFFAPEPAIIATPIATALERRGHTVDVLTTFPNYPGGRVFDGYRMRPLQREEIDGVRVSRVPMYPSHDRSATRRIASYTSFAVAAATIGTMATRRGDVTYVYHPPATAALPALVWKRLRSMPFVLHVQDLWPDSVIGSGFVSGRRQRQLERALTWWCDTVYRAAERVVVQSEGFKNILVERGVAEEKVIVVPNWTDETLFFPQARDETLRAELSKYPADCVVLYARNLGPFQGLQTAIRAAHRCAHLNGFRLVLAGRGNAEAELRDLASELGTGNVAFVGSLPYPEMGRYNAAADALLVSLDDSPALRGTIPGKTQVAMASGRPILGSLTGDPAALVGRAGAGFVTAPGDDEALATVFERFFAMPLEERAALGLAGRAFHEQELSLDRAAEQFESILTAAAG